MAAPSPSQSMPDKSAVEQSSATVVVACKLPHGLILQLSTMRKFSMPAAGGGSKDEERAIRLPDTHRVNGNAHPQTAAPKCFITPEGYALTPGIPKEFWRQWLEQNKDSDIVRNRLIYAHSERASVEDFSADNEKTKSGLERLDPLNLPGANGKVTVADEMKAKLAA